MNVGHFVLALALINGLAALGLYIYAATCAPEYARPARLFAAAMTLFVVFASVLQWVNIMTHQFQYEYVRNFTDRALPDLLLFTTFWGGQAGSFMLWALMCSLFTLALTSQNAPGQAVLRNAGYEVPINKALVVTGVSSLVGAPFGGHGITLSAITAAMVTGPETHPDPDKRYSAGVATGFWFIVTGIFGATVATLFAGLPLALIHAISGLALAAAIMSALSASMAEPSGREGALVAFMCTAPNFTFLNIGAPFWGLVFGVLTHLLMTYGKNPPEKNN